MSKIVSYDSSSSLLTIQSSVSENFTIKYPNYSGEMSKAELSARVALEKLNSTVASGFSFLSLGKRLLSALSAVSASISESVGQFLSRMHSAVASHFMTTPELETLELDEREQYAPEIDISELEIEIPEEDPELEHAFIHVVKSKVENVAVDYHLEPVEPDLSGLDLEERFY